MFFKELRLKMRAAKRLGAFTRALQQGMSSEQARIYSDGLYPPTAEDLEYEEKLRNEEAKRERAATARMVCMSDPIAEIVATCFRTVLSDEPWQDIGFAKRPRYGAFFQRFRPEWRTDLEKRTLQEMLATLTAAHVVAGRVSLDDIPTIVAAYTARTDVVTALGYSSREESTRHLSQTIAQYCRTPIGDWASVIAKRLEPASIPDKTLSASLLVGCVRFSQNMGNLVLVLRRDRFEARTP